MQILNQNEGAVDASSPLHFLFYDVKIYNTSMRQVVFDFKVYILQLSCRSNLALLLDENFVLFYISKPDISLSY